MVPGAAWVAVASVISVTVPVPAVIAWLIASVPVPDVCRLTAPFAVEVLIPLDPPTVHTVRLLLAPFTNDTDFTLPVASFVTAFAPLRQNVALPAVDRKSTRLNSSHPI